MSKKQILCTPCFYHTQKKLSSLKWNGLSTLFWLERERNRTNSTVVWKTTTTTTKKKQKQKTKNKSWDNIRRCQASSSVWLLWGIWYQVVWVITLRSSTQLLCCEIDLSVQRCQQHNWCPLGGHSVSIALCHLISEQDPSLSLCSGNVFKVFISSWESAALL